MLIKIKIPNNIMDLQNNAGFISMNYTHEDKDYIITKEILSDVQNNVTIDSDHFHYNIPPNWIEVLLTVDSVLGIENDDYALVVVESKDGFRHEVIYKHMGWNNKYFVMNAHNVLTPIKATDVIAKLNLMISQNYRIVTRITDLKTIKKYIIAIPINIIHRDIYADQKSLHESNTVLGISYNDNPNADGSIYTTYDYKIDFTNLMKNRNMLYVLSQALVPPTPKMRSVQELIDEMGEKKEKEKKEKRLDALMSIKDDSHNDIEIDLINNTISNKHVKKQDQIFRATKEDYKGQAIKFKGMCVHHGLSNNGIAQNLIKMPRNLTFLKVRVNGWMNNRIKTKDFAFNKEGLLSAMVYRDNNTRFENSDQLTLNPYIKSFIELIGAEEFVKLYDVTPNFNHLDVGNLIVKRFFKKDVILESNITNRVQNIIPTTRYAKELLDTMPAGFLIFIKTRWCVNEKKLNFEIIKEMNAIQAEQYDNLPKAAIGSNVCLVNGDPIYFSNDYEQLSNIVNIIAAYITKIVNIYKGDYKEINE